MLACAIKKSATGGNSLMQEQRKRQKEVDVWYIFILKEYVRKLTSVFWQK